MSDVFVGDNDHGDTPLPPLSDLLWAEVTKLRQDKVRLEEDIVHFANELNEVTHQRDEARRYEATPAAFKPPSGFFPALRCHAGEASCTGTQLGTRRPPLSFVPLAV